MKKSIAGILVSGSLAISIAAASCAQPAPAAPKPEPAPATPGAVAQRTIKLIFGDNPPDDQTIMDELELATLGFIAELIMSGQPVPDHEYTALRSIEDARQALKELEEQRLATQTLVNQCITGGKPVASFDIATLESIEQARLASLRRTGLVD